MPLLLAMSLLTAAADPAIALLEKETTAWHDKRQARLRAEDGWLALVGLHWLDEGPNDVLPDVGTFIRKGKAVELKPAAKASLTNNGKPFAGGNITTDANGARPDLLRSGTLQLFVIERGERVGVRVRDSEAKARKEFHGIARYPVSLGWKKDAKFELAKPGETLPIPNVLGDVTDEPLYGTAVFTHEGQEVRLLATKDGDTLFFVFGDLTNRTETYGAGRFLYTELPKDGRVALDFNRAFNPPCAFSPFATCPLPVRENKLKLRIDAGEKRYGEH